MIYKIIAGLAAGLYFISMTLLTRFVTYYYVVSRVDTNMSPLRDSILDNIDPIPWTFRISEFIITGLIFALVVVSALNKQHRFCIITRYLTIEGTMLLFRMLCIVSTVLPIPNPDDVNKCLLLQQSSLMDRLTNIYTCGDYVYSGHGASMVIVTWLVINYIDIQKMYKNILAGIMSIIVMFGLLCIICSKEHYTVDVILGAYIGFTLCSEYHYRFIYVIEPDKLPDPDKLDEIAIV